MKVFLKNNSNKIIKLDAGELLSAIIFARQNPDSISLRFDTKQLAMVHSLVTNKPVLSRYTQQVAFESKALDPGSWIAIATILQALGAMLSTFCVPNGSPQAIATWVASAKYRPLRRFRIRTQVRKNWRGPPKSRQWLRETLPDAIAASAEQLTATEIELGMKEV